MYMPGDEPDLRLLVVFSVADLDTVRVFAESNKIKYDITSAPRDTWQSVTADALLQLRTEVAVEMLTGAQDTKRLPFGRHLWTWDTPHYVFRDGSIRPAIDQADLIEVYSQIEKCLASRLAELARRKQAKAACMEVWREAGYLDQMLTKKGTIRKRLRIRKRSFEANLVSAEYKYCDFDSDGRPAVHLYVGGIKKSRTPVRHPRDVFPPEVKKAP